MTAEVVPMGGSHSCRWWLVWVVYFKGGTLIQCVFFPHFPAPGVGMILQRKLPSLLSEVVNLYAIQQGKSQQSFMEA